MVVGGLYDDTEHGEPLAVQNRGGYFALFIPSFPRGDRV